MAAKIGVSTLPELEAGVEPAIEMPPGPSWIDNLCELACSLALAGMIVLIGAEAFARNLFNTSLQITDEVGGYLLVAVTFLSLSVSQAHGAYHHVELVQARLSPRARLRSQMLFDVLSLLTCAILTWQLARMNMNSWRSEDFAPTPLGTPLWIPQMVMPIGMALMCLALARTVFVKMRRLHALDGRRGGASVR